MTLNYNPTMLRPYYIGLLLLICGMASNVHAQLDTWHYVPPFYAKPGDGTGFQNIGEHFVSLSTPSESTIPVFIHRADGQLVDVVEISKDSPAEYLFGTGNASTGVFPLNVIPEDSLNTPLKTQGLIFTSFQSFFVNMRHKSGNQGTSLTTKGQVAKGKRFYSGHLYTTYNNTDNADQWNNERRAHFISVMATEDNTTVTFDMIKDPIALIGFDVGEPVTAVLMADESFTVGIDHSLYDDDSINNSNGIRISSDKDIVCNTGSWLSGNQSGQDIGSDQLVAAENVGTEYILIRGLGNPSTERPMVVATADNTQVFLNGSSDPLVELDEGEFYFFNVTQFSDNDNMYVETDKNAYMYQTQSGSATQPGPTMGLSVIPPLNCVGARVVNIPFVNSLAASPGNGRINVLTKAGGGVFLNGDTEPLSDPQSVPGNDDWVTYSFTPTSDNVQLESDSVMNVALLTRDEVIGTSGYFSGFTLEPVVSISNVVEGTLPCAPGNAVLQVAGFDAYQWYFNGEEIPGETGPSLVPEFSGEYTVEGIDKDCGFRFLSNTFQIPLCPSTIGAAKEEVQVTETETGSRIFDIDYRIYIQNFSPTEAVNIQVIENIQGGLVPGATVSLISGPELAFGDLTGGVNEDFDGINDRRLLPGDGSMPGEHTFALDLTLRVDMNNAVQDGFFNQVTVTTKEIGPNNGQEGPFIGQDFSHQGDNPDPNGTGQPNEEGANDPTLTCFFSNEFEYTAEAFCTTDNDSIPLELDGIFSGVFSSDGLQIDSLSGSFLPSANEPGTYTVVYTTTGRCPKETETTVTIVGLPNAGESSVEASICTDFEDVMLSDFLVGADQDGFWQDTDSAEVPDAYDPTEAGEFIFTYILDAPPCELQSQELILNVIAAPNTGQAADEAGFCMSEGAVNLFDFLSDADEDGSWLDADGEDTSAEFEPEVGGTYSFTYNIEHPVCGSYSTELSLVASEETFAGVSLGSTLLCVQDELDLLDLILDASETAFWVDQGGSLLDTSLVAFNSPGEFEYFFIDVNEPCPADTATVIVEVGAGLSPGIISGPIRICPTDPPVNLFALLAGADTGGIWLDGDGNETDSFFLPQSLGSFTRIYRVESEECGVLETTVEIIVTETECLITPLVIPQGFSPNGDGVGDFWVIQGLENFPNNVVKIFNRWGAEVFSSRPYNSDWNGRAQSGVNAGAPLPVGTYFYILDLGDGSEPRKGYVFLNR